MHNFKAIFIFLNEIKVGGYRDINWTFFGRWMTWGFARCNSGLWHFLPRPWRCLRFWWVMALILCFMLGKGSVFVRATALLKLGCWGLWAQAWSNPCRVFFDNSLFQAKLINGFWQRNRMSCWVTVCCPLLSISPLVRGTANYPNGIILSALERF